MTHCFTGHEIELANGNPFDPSNPDPSMIDLDAIAHALGNLCRYGGHSRWFFSVGEHSVSVAKKLRQIGAPLAIQFAGLHHDNAEALNGLGDPQRPAKDLLDPKFRERETMIDKCVWQALACTHTISLWQPEDLSDPLVKAVDTWALGFEAKRLMVSQGVGWEQAQGSAVPIPDSDQDEFKCLPPEWAKLEFIEMHNALVSEHRGIYG